MTFTNSIIGHLSIARTFARAVRRRDARTRHACVLADALLRDGARSVRISVTGSGNVAPITWSVA